MQSASTPLSMPRGRAKMCSWQNALGKKSRKRPIREVVESEDDDGEGSVLSLGGGSIDSAESAPRMHDTCRLRTVGPTPIKRIASNATLSSTTTRVGQRGGQRVGNRVRSETPNSILDDCDARSCTSVSNSVTESNTSAQRKAHSQKKNWMKTRKIGLGEPSAGAPPVVFFGSNQNA